MNANQHISVLANQVIRFLAPDKGKVIVDCTLGAGGHSILLLEVLNNTGAIYGIDSDERNLEIAQQNLKNFSNIHFIHDNFENLETIGREILQSEGHIDGILMDLGISSMHIENPERGFSFQKQGPLDMRFNARQNLTAADIVNTYSLEDLHSIFKVYGEEKFSYRIAEQIIKHRKRERFSTTTQLADFIKSVVPPKFRYGRIHPATRIFQALRVAANREVEVLNAGLVAAVNILSKNGRLAVISYHSLEDRIVKNFFKDRAAHGEIAILTKKPVTPDEEEIAVNRRSRSAKLRSAEKL